MSFDYSYAADIENETKSSGKVEKGLKRLLIVAAVIFAVQLIWLFGISPFIPFSTIEVQEIAGLEKSAILQYAGINETSSYISTNTAVIQEKLAANLLIESAVVIKRFPDRLSIYLTPRQAAAVSLTTIGSRQVPLYVDRQGVFFKAGHSELRETSLPVLSGFENPRLNMRLPAALVPLVRNLSEIASNSPELLAAVSEIRIESKAWDGYDLVLFPVHSSIKVRLENNLTEEALRYMLLMLNVFEEASPKPAEIDFRSGMGSYKIKEQS